VAQPFVRKIVVARKRWFAANANDTRDLLPDGWVRIRPSFQSGGTIKVGDRLK
jgi:hypothetical protein